MIRGSAGGGLVVNLPADNGGVVPVMLKEFSDHALAVEAVGGIHQVGILTITECNGLSAEARDYDLRMLLVHPGRNGVGRSAKNDFDACLLHPINHAIHPGIFEATILRFP